MGQVIPNWAMGAQVRAVSMERWEQVWGHTLRENERRGVTQNERTTFLIQKRINKWGSRLQGKWVKKEMCFLRSEHYRFTALFWLVPYTARSNQSVHTYPFLLSLPPTPSHPSRSPQSTGLSSQDYTAGRHEMATLHTAARVRQRCSLNPSYPPLPLICAQSILYVCISIPALQTRFINIIRNVVFNAFVWIHSLQAAWSRIKFCLQVATGQINYDRS